MTQKITYSLLAGLLLCSLFSNAQSVGIGTETPSSNAILELVAPNNDQGLLVPRMTTAQRTATTFTSNLSAADNGLMVYDSDLNTFFFWINTQWEEVTTGNLTGLPDQTGQTGRYLTTDGTNAAWTEVDFLTLVNVPADLADGDDVNDADADASNELQDLSLASNTLSLSGSAATADLSSYLDNTDQQDLDFTSGVLSLSGDPDATLVDLSNYDTDATDDFDGAFTSLSGIPAGLSDGDDVNDADADATNEIQDLDFTAGVISLSGDPDATLIDLSNYDTDVTDDFDGAFTSLSSIPTGLSDGDDVNDADADPTNEYQDLNLSGNTLSLTNSAVTVDLTPFAGTNTDNQTISLTGTDLSITGGNILDVSSLVDDADADPNNENQTVSAGTGISISQTLQDFQVTNTAPDQIVSLADGGSGNITIGGAYPSFTIDVPNNLDNDPANENQTVSAGTGISISQTLQDFQVTNTAPDQTVSLADGGSGNVAIGGAYPSFTIDVPNNLDNDPANENQTVSAGTGISISQTLQDFQVTNTAPDQTVSLADGGSGNVTIGGAYPSFTIDVPNNLDNDPANENQTVSAGTGISISQTLQDFQVTNTAPDQTVSLADGGSGNVTIGGSYPSFTIDVPNNLDNDPNNEIELPAQVGQGGNFLTTNGTVPSWSALNESQWTTNGSSINYSAGNVNIGAGTIPSSRLQLTTNNVSSTVPQLTIQESDASSDASMYFNRSGTNITMGVDGTDGYFKISGANALGNNDRLIIDNLGTVGIGVTPNAQFHVQTNAIESSVIRANNTHSGAGAKIGLHNILDNQGTADKTGVFNDIDGTTGETAPIIGVSNAIAPADGITYGVSTVISGVGTGIRYGTFANITGAASNSSIIYGARSTITNNGSGATYGFYSDLGSAGTGTRFGSYTSVLGSASNTSAIYGSRADVTHSGNGDSYGYYANVNSSGSGLTYGFYAPGVSKNFFEGNVGIGGDLDPTHQLSILSTVASSTLPMVRVRAGNSSSDASVYMNIQGGSAFTFGIDATDSHFKISNSSALGTTDRVFINTAGDLGLGAAPSAKLDVVGTTELNGATNINNTLTVTGITSLTSTLGVTGQITGQADIQIPETNAYTYASPQTRQTSYHPTEFKVLKNGGGTEELHTASAVNLAVFFANGSGALGYATNPVKLPDGAVVTSVEAWIFDNDVSNFGRIELYRTDVGSSTLGTVMATVETTSESASAQPLSTASIGAATIDNGLYTYRLLYTANDMTNQVSLHGVRITYTVQQVD